jgi:hypothetical protein
MKSTHWGVIFAIVVAVGTIAYAQTDPVKVGKTGDIILAQETSVGDTVLPPGDYEVRHRKSGGGHFVEFGHYVGNWPPLEWESGAYWEVAAKVPCLMQPLDAEVRQTRVGISGGPVAQMKTLALRGENVLHLLASASSPQHHPAQAAEGAAMHTATHGHSHDAAIGKTGNLTLKQETTVGNQVLPAGDYQVRHRQTANAHVMEFTRVTENLMGAEGRSPYEWEVVADIPCSVQPLAQRVATTQAEISGGAYLNSLKIRGENVVHVFPGSPDASAPQNRVEYGGGGA